MRLVPVRLPGSRKRLPEKPLQPGAARTCCRGIELENTDGNTEEGQPVDLKCQRAALDEVLPGHQPRKGFGKRSGERHVAARRVSQHRDVRSLPGGTLCIGGIPGQCGEQCLLTEAFVLSPCGEGPRVRRLLRIVLRCGRETLSQLPVG
jgi:hypothetical protein